MKKEAMQMKVFSLCCSAKETMSSVFERKSIMIMLMALVCVCNIMPVFADGLFDELATQLRNAYNSFIPIVNICALIFGGAAGIAFMMSSDEKSAASAKDGSSELLLAGLSFLCFRLFSPREEKCSAVQQLELEQTSCKISSQEANKKAVVNGISWLYIKKGAFVKMCPFFKQEERSFYAKFRMGKFINMDSGCVDFGIRLIRPKHVICIFPKTNYNGPLFSWS